MLTLIDILIVIFLIGLFYFLNLTGILPIVVCIVGGLLLHFAFAGVFNRIEKKKEEEKLIYDQENRIQNVILKFSENSTCSDEIYRWVRDFTASLSDFLKKKEVLLEISNDAFIRNEISEAEDYLIRLADRLDTKLKIVGAVDEYDVAYDDITADIKKIASITEAYVQEIGKLLVEVGRSKDDDDDDERKKRISKSTDRLKEIRKESSKLFEEEPIEGLFVATSSGSNFNIGI